LLVVNYILLPTFILKKLNKMREEKFLYYVNYTINMDTGEMIISYKDIQIKTIFLTKNKSYNIENESLAYQIALDSELGQKLVKGEI
jgi:hypothetical protein